MCWTTASSVIRQIFIHLNQGWNTNGRPKSHRSQVSPLPATTQSSRISKPWKVRSYQVNEQHQLSLNSIRLLTDKASPLFVGVAFSRQHGRKCAEGSGPSRAR